MKPSSVWFTSRWGGDIRKAAAAAVSARRPTWSCACSFSNTCATGATRCSSAKCAPIWSTATSPASAAARCPTPRRSAEVLRFLVLNHVRNWSYEVLEREVRANLVYRDFTRVGGGKMPDAKTIGRWGLAVGPETVKQVHERLVQMAKAEGIATGRRMRVDTTVVETNVHYPTDSSLLGDGVRVLTRAMKKITAIAGDIGAKLRDRSRSVKLRVLDIARAARAQGPQRQERA